MCKIQSVKAVKKGMRDIPKAFEIFTTDQTYVFKVKDGKNAEQWVQCLQIAVARSQKPEEGSSSSSVRERRHTRDADRDLTLTPDWDFGSGLVMPLPQQQQQQPGSKQSQTKL